MNNKIKYGRQEITQTDIDAVNEVLRSDWLTQGPMIPFFEETVSISAATLLARRLNFAP